MFYNISLYPPRPAFVLSTMPPSLDQDDALRVPSIYVLPDPDPLAAKKAFLNRRVRIRKPKARLMSRLYTAIAYWQGLHMTAFACKYSSSFSSFLCHSTEYS